MTHAFRRPGLNAYRPWNGLAITYTLCVLFAIVYSSTALTQVLEISGKGASFPKYLYSETMYAYNLVKPTTEINKYKYQLDITYEGVGSGAGKRAIIDNKVHFAGSDSLLNEEEKELGRDLLMIPLFAGAVVPAYNLKSIPALRSVVLTREALAGIFLGQITTWDHNLILQSNDWGSELQQQLSGRNITVLFRSDSSGTTEMLTAALSRFSPEWNRSFGVSSKIEWPTETMAAHVPCDGGNKLSDELHKTEGGIG